MIHFIFFIKGDSLAYHLRSFCVPQVEKRCYTPNGTLHESVQHNIVILVTLDT